MVDHIISVLGCERAADVLAGTPACCGATANSRWASSWRGQMLGDPNKQRDRDILFQAAPEPWASPLSRVARASSGAVGSPLSLCGCVARASSWSSFQGTCRRTVSSVSPPRFLSMCLLKFGVSHSEFGCVATFALLLHRCHNKREISLSRQHNTHFGHPKQPNPGTVANGTRAQIHRKAATIVPCTMRGAASLDAISISQLNAVNPYILLANAAKSQGAARTRHRREIENDNRYA